MPRPAPRPTLCPSGFEPLTNETRKHVYNSEYTDFSFDEPDYAMVDTLFSLAEAYLFMQLVELKVRVMAEGMGSAALIRAGFAVLILILLMQLVEPHTRRGVSRSSFGGLSWLPFWALALTKRVTERVQHNP